MEPENPGMETQNSSKQQKQIYDEHSALGRALDWLVPLSISIGVGLLTFLLSSFLDYQKGDTGFLNTMFMGSQEADSSNVGNLAEVLIGTLGLTLTVVAIVVQLAAQRYTPKLVDLFLADRVNIFTFLGMVLTTIFGIWVIYSFRQGHVPVYGNVLLMSFTTLLLALLLPYFRYVFNFLTPSSIIETIEQNLAKSVKDASAGKGNGSREKYKFQVANGLEQVTDIALSAVTQMDRNVALMSIDTVSRILREYNTNKKQLGEYWFRPNLAHFISISSEFFEDIQERKIWVEARGLMDLELIFGQALKTMPDAVSAIATNTRYMAQTALENGDREAATLCVEYFNTFIRRAINDKNQRAVFSLFYQYKRMAENLVPKHMDMVQEITNFFQYYGKESLRGGIPFILVVGAMDTCDILKLGFQENAENLDPILDSFLQIQDNPEIQKIPFVHQGVRKAHSILAAHLMALGNMEKSLEKITKSMKLEDPKWLSEVKNSLLGVEKRKFWEITDRGGINFEYMEPEMKKWLSEYYKKYLSA